MAGEENLRGKTVVDATNPIADAPPDNGVLKFFTSLDRSLMEELQSAFPDAHLVKAFNSVGNALMVNPDFGGTRPKMFICGNDAGAKREVSEILDVFGFEVEDMGGRSSRARHRAALHPVVHPRFPAQPLDACIQALEELIRSS